MRYAHGTTDAYQGGCRCDGCRIAAEYQLVAGVEVERTDGWWPLVLRPTVTRFCMDLRWRRTCSMQARAEVWIRAERRMLLTPREVEVLRLVAEGLTDREIARGLGISEKTVITHVQNTRHRLNATCRTHAVVLALRAGLIPLDPAQPTPAAGGPATLAGRVGVAS